MGTLTGVSWDIPHQQALLSLIAAVALGLLLLGLAAVWVPGIAWGLAVLGVQFGTRLALDPAGTQTWAPLFGAGLLMVAELAYLSLEIRANLRSRLRSRLTTIAFLTIGTAVAAELVLLAASLVPARGFILVAAGAAAVGVLLASLVVASGRPGRRSP